MIINYVNKNTIEIHNHMYKQNNYFNTIKAKYCILILHY